MNIERVLANQSPFLVDPPDSPDHLAAPQFRMSSATRHETGFADRLDHVPRARPGYFDGTEPGLQKSWAETNGVADQGEDRDALERGVVIARQNAVFFV